MAVGVSRAWFSSLEEIGAETCYGTKAANISMLCRAGFKVPDGWVIRARDALDLLRVEGDSGCAIFDDFCADERIRDSEYGLIVRSSFACEDELSNSSFAGVFESAFVTNRAAAVRDGLARCVASLVARTPQDDSAKALRIPEQGGILIQTAIRPLISGIYFSHAPFEPFSDSIEATRGLSVGINSGFVQPARFQQPRSDSVEGNRLYEFLRQEQAVVLLPASRSDLDVAPADFISYGGHGYNACKVLAHVLDSNLLVIEGRRPLSLGISDVNNLLRSVRTLGWNISTDLMESEVDVEWCADESGALWIVQVRRALGAQQAESPEPRDYVDKQCWVGTPASTGSAIGRAIVARTEFIPAKPKGKYVLILDSAERVGIELLLGASAIVSGDMGLLSHTAILARELGIPCIIDAHEVIENVRNGDFLAVVGEKGLVERIAPSSKAEFLGPATAVSGGESGNAAKPYHPYREFHYISVSRGQVTSVHKCPSCLVYETLDEGYPEPQCHPHKFGGIAGHFVIDRATSLAYLHWAEAGPTEFVLMPRHKIGTLCLFLSMSVGDSSLTEAKRCCSSVMLYHVDLRLDLLE